MLERIRRYPATLGILAVVLAVSLARAIAHAMHHGGTWELGYSAVVHGHEPWRIVTAPVVVSGIPQLLAVLALGITVIPISERRLGSWRTAGAWAATGILGPALALGLQYVGIAMHELGSRTAQHAVMAVPLAGLIGTLVLTAAKDRIVWQRRLSALLLAVFGVLVLYTSNPILTAYLLSGLVGGGLGLAGRSRPKRPMAYQGSHRAARRWVAFVVAATAVGPLIGLTQPDRPGPLAPLGELFITDDPASTPLAGLLLDVAPSIVLLVAAYGMLRGSRIAAIVAMCATTLAALIATWCFVVLPLLSGGFDWSSAGSIETNLTYLLAGAIFAIIALVIAANLGHFTVPARPRIFRRLGLGAIAITAPLAIIFTVAACAMGQSPLTAWIGLPLNAVPPALLQNSSLAALDQHSPMATLELWSAVAIWGLMTILLGRLIAATAPKHDPQDRTRLRELLRRHGGGTLGFMATWPGNRTWFAETGEAAVTYRLVGRTAIVLSDPVCAPADVSRTFTEFIRWCDDNGQTTAFYSLHNQVAALTGGNGWKAIQVGVESIISVESFSLSGKRKQNIRTAINRAGREGVQAVWTAFEQLDASQRGRLRALSKSWKQGKPLPEMGFTLGRFEQLADPDVRLMLAVSQDGTITAITSWLPSYRDDACVGYTLDVMRRGADAMPGSVEFLIAATVLRAKDDGMEFVSLSGSPLAAAPSDPAGLAERIGERVAKTLEPVYHFRSLASFKTAFQPEQVPLWLAYPDETTLPQTLAAIGRAYVPTIRFKEALTLVRTISDRR
ncbi:phosphatidylglycerol lysyltransferase domain-containing protein [Humibacter ginsengisoli]